MSSLLKFLRITLAYINDNILTDEEYFTSI